MAQENKKKIVEFIIPRKELKIEEYKATHNRRHIILLFQQLQREGFGSYFEGHRGRTGAARFVPNDKCPEKYELEIEEKKRGRKAAAPMPEEN